MGYTKGKSVGIGDRRSRNRPPWPYMVLARAPTTRARGYVRAHNVKLHFEAALNADGKGKARDFVEKRGPARYQQKPLFALALNKTG